MRFYSKHDATLGVILIFSAIIAFHQPLRSLLDAAHEVETRYSVDLVPALTVLMAVLAFHEHRKRQRSRMQKIELQAEIGRERARSGELEQCIRLAQVLAELHDEPTLEQALWQHLPAFVRDEAWLLTCRQDKWRLVFQKAPSDRIRPIEDLEGIARKALPGGGSGGFTPVLMSEETCFPLVAGGTVVGMLGVRHAERLTGLEQESLLVAAALMALTIKNIQQFHELTEEGVRDSLTGCYNRRHGVDRLSGELRRAGRSGRPVSVLMLDLDRFKTINDAYGHLTGDRLLAQVGRELMQSLRSTDIPCRYGGDEFLIVLPETPTQAAEHVAAGISALTFALDDQIQATTVSVGVATSTPGELSVEAVIERADQALFAAKRDGRRRSSTSVVPGDRAVAS